MTSTTPVRPRRFLLFGILCLACVAIVGGYLALVLQRQKPQAGQASDMAIDSPEAQSALSQGPYLVFRSNLPGPNYHKVEAVPISVLAGPRYVSSLHCERVYVASGSGMCLTSDWVDLRVPAYTFDSQFRRGTSVSLVGNIPSRVRVSPNGKFSATTMFVGQDGYAAVGFSTRTAMVDQPTGAILFDLEQLKVTRGGQPLFNRNFNFWGVTFAQDNQHFFATLGSGSSTFLIRGDIAARTADVLLDNVECPSLSPDGSRIAFKLRYLTNGQVSWRLTSLNLQTMVETPLAETRSIDDQVEWLDNNRILYEFNNDTWVVAANGSGSPTVFLAGASSPSVVR